MLSVTSTSEPRNYHHYQSLVIAYCRSSTESEGSGCRVCDVDRNHIEARAERGLRTDDNEAGPRWSGKRNQGLQCTYTAIKLDPD
jgi:hypothetical protein